MFEAELVKIHVQKLIQAGLNTEEIGVITPYNAQTVLVKQTLADFESEKDESNSSNPQHDIKNVEVSTVDGFQGREKTAIILTLVRSNPENKIGFLKELRRLNVAVTRAKSHLFVVGDGLTLQKGENGILADFIDFLLKNGVEYFANEFEFDEKYADRFREIRLKDEQIWIDGSNLAKKAAKPQNDAKKSKVQNQKTAKNSEILDPKISYQIEFNLDRLWKFFDQENQQEIRFVEVLPIVRAKIHDVCETIDASQEKFTHQSHDEEGKRILVVRRTKDLEAERRERERLDAINRPVNKKFDKLTIEESRTGSDEEKDQAEDPNLVLCELSGQMVPKENLEIFQIRYRKHQQYMQEQEKQKLMQQEKTRQQQNSMKNSQKSSTKSKPKKSGTAPNTQTKKSASKNTKDGKKKRGDMDNLDDILDFIEDETDEVLKPKGENLVQQIIREGSNKVRGKNFQPESRSRDLKKKQLKNKLGGKLKEMEKDRSKASKK